MEMPTPTQLPDTLSGPAIVSWIVAHRAPPLAPGPSDCRSGLRYHFDRRLRKAFLSSLRLGSTARNAHRILGRTGQPFWQDESFDRYLRRSSQIERTIDYIQNNPVSARLVLPGELALVQRGLAGETACPTNGQQCTG